MVLVLAVLLLLATYSTKISSKIGVPGLVIFLLIGMLFGGGALNLINFTDYVTAQAIANLCLIFILFEGGLSTKKENFKATAAPAGLLATVGVIITAIVFGLALHYILGLDLYIALLLGAITSSTDAAAIFATFKDKLVKKDIAATLEVESASNDPMAIILTVSMINFMQNTLGSSGSVILNFFWQFIAGVLMGIVVAKLAVYMFNKINLDNQSFYYVLILAVGLLTFGLSELIGGNGFMAVFITGVIIGNSEYAFKRGVTLFVDGVSTFAHVILFLILGLLVHPAEALGVWKEGVGAALLLMFIARPVAVFITLAYTKRYTLKERIFLSWAGIKGSVPIVLGTYPLVAGIPEGRYIFNLVFFVVLLSTTIQGATIPWVAKMTDLFIGVRKRRAHSMELLSLEKTHLELVEYSVDDISVVAGMRIEDLDLPAQTLVVSIIRGDDIIAPNGSTILEDHDILYLLVSYKDQARVAECLDGYSEKSKNRL